MKVAVIGVGSMGKNHARIYFNNESVQLIGVADPDPEAVAKIARKYNTLAYCDYKQLLAREDLDAVSIVVPTKYHRDVAIHALNSGKHVLLEKPIAETEIEAKEIIECAKRNNKILMIGHIEQFNTAILKLKEKLDQKELGDIYKIDVQRIGPFPSRVSDVGVIIDLSVHDIDIINFLLDKEPHRIYAETQQKLHPYHEDSVIALLRYEDGILATLNVNYLSPTKIRQLKVFGEKGMFAVDYLNQELRFFENSGYRSEQWGSVIEGKMIKYHIKKKEPLEVEIDAFLNCIKNNKMPVVTGEKGLRALQIAKLFIRSATEKAILHPDNNEK